MRLRLADIIDRDDTRAGRAFTLLFQSLIVISILSFSIETLPGLDPGLIAVLDWLETITVLLFSIEYVLRLIAAKDRLRYVFSFYGLIDLFAVLPFYLSFGLDLRALRIVRLLRLLKFLRYTRALDRVRRAFAVARDELVIFGVATGMVLFLSAVGIYYFEHDAQPEVFASVFHSLWWAVTTLTTVGYGDMYPITPGGRFFAFVVLMVGLGIVAVPAGLTASALTQVREEAARDTMGQSTPGHDESSD